MPRLLLGLLTAAVACLPAFAQAPVVTDPVKAAIAKFQQERAEAEKTFTKEELAGADEQATKAQAALAAGNLEQARRLITEARWQLPIQQQNLPENVIRVLGASRLRHGDRVNSLAYSPDGSKLVSASRDGTVRVWDVGNGREIAVYRGHEGAEVVEEDRSKKIEGVNELRAPGVSFSADGKRIASAGSTEIHIWEADSAKSLKVLKGHTKDVLCVAFAPNSPDLLLSGGADKKFMVWDVTKDEPTHTSDEQSGPVEAVAFSADERYAAAGEEGGGVVVYATNQWDKLVFGSKVTQKSGLKTLGFTRDASGLIVGGDGGQLIVVGGPGGPESALGNTLVSMSAHTGTVSGQGTTPNGKLLASIADDRTVVVWELPAGRQIRAFQTETSAKAGTCLAVRSDGRQIAAGFESGQIRLFPLSDTDDHRQFAESKVKLMTAVFSPDGSRFATAGGDAEIRVYDTASGTLVKELKGHKIAVTALTWLSNTQLVSGGADKVVKIWDVASGTAKDGEGHTVAVLAVAADPAGKLLLSGAADKSLRGWNPETGQPTKLKIDGNSAVCAIAINPTATRVAVGLANGKLQLFEVSGDSLTPTGEVTSAHNAGVAAVAFHPNGTKLISCGGDGAVRLWSAPVSGNPVRERDFSPPFQTAPGAPPMPVTSVAFSPDGKMIVGGGAEGVVRIWDALDGGEIRGLRGHTAWVTSVQFDPEGKTVLSCAVDATARIFDLPRMESVATGHSASVNCIAVSRDGKYAATGSGDLTVKVWDLSTGREVATLTGEAEAKSFNSEAGLLSVVFLGNDKVAATGHEKKLRTWSFAPNKLIGTPMDLPQASFVLSADPDGKAVAVAWTDGNFQGQSTSGFNLFPTDGEPITIEVKSKGQDDATSSAALSPDAKWGVIGGRDGVIQFWDLVRKERIGGEWPILANGAAVWDIGMTPDRKMVVVINEEGEVKVADTSKREVTATCQAVDGEVRGIIVAPTSDKFATLAGDGTVKAWDMAGKEIRTWKLPHAPTCAVFTADGKRLLTGNQDGTALVLELPAK